MHRDETHIHRDETNNHMESLAHIVSSLAGPGEVDKELDEGVDSHQLVEDRSDGGRLDGISHVGEGSNLMQQHRATGILWRIQEGTQVSQQRRKLLETRL